MNRPYYKITWISAWKKPAIFYAYTSYEAEEIKADGRNLQYLVEVEEITKEE